MSNFERVHALLDTNVLSEMINPSKQAEHFKPLFAFLEENKMIPIYLEVTDFELKGYSTNKKSFEAKENYLKTFNAWKIPFSATDIETASKLSAMYKCKNSNINPKQISFVDCLHAVQLLKYKEKIAIVTTDLNDYPSFLFDMDKYFAIPADTGETSFVGIKTFNAEKLKALETCFEKSGG